MRYLNLNVLLSVGDQELPYNFVNIQIRAGKFEYKRSPFLYTGEWMENKIQLSVFFQGVDADEENNIEASPTKPFLHLDLLLNEESENTSKVLGKGTIDESFHVLGTPIFEGLTQKVSSISGYATTVSLKKGIIDDAIKSVCKVWDPILRKLVQSGTLGTFSPFQACGKIYSAHSGYWFLGNEGPAGLIPFYQQTLYLPKTTGYKFWTKKHKSKVTQKITGSVWNLEMILKKLEELLKSDISQKLGTDTWAKGIKAAREFYKEWGEFALTGIYSPNTRESRIYVFCKKLGSSQREVNKVLNSDFIKFIMKIQSFIFPAQLVRKVRYKAGSSFKDECTLTSTKAIIGGTPLIYFYLFGTVKIKLS